MFKNLGKIFLIILIYDSPVFFLLQFTKSNIRQGSDEHFTGPSTKASGLDSDI